MQRRDFMTAAAATTIVAASANRITAKERPIPKFAFGLVTYMWGAQWDLPTLIANCEKCDVLGVELRTTHKHGVEPTLSDKQRADVRKRFADSKVRLVGIGSNERYDNPNPDVVNKAIEATKEFVILSHDVGGTGVKVKPDRFHNNVPREKTIEQIGRSLNELGEFAAGYGQQIRLEVHGGCAELPTIKAIMDVADNDNVTVCWNSNPQDLQGDGLAHNFHLVRKRFGQTLHARPLDDKTYPYEELLQLLVETDWAGWVMLEDGRVPKDIVGELARARRVFDAMVAKIVKG